MAPEQGLDRKKEASAEMKDWIYRLSKADLVSELETLGIDTDGTVDDLRRRLSRYVDQHPDEFRAATPTVSSESPATPAPPPDPDTRPAKVMSQMRKWGLHFDGKDPWAFLERIDELRDEYGYSDEINATRITGSAKRRCPPLVSKRSRRVEGLVRLHSGIQDGVFAPPLPPATPGRDPGTQTEKRRNLPSILDRRTVADASGGRIYGGRAN